MSQTQYAFFGEHRAMEALSQQGDRLVELERHIDWVPLIAAAEKICRANADPAYAGQKIAQATRGQNATNHIHEIGRRGAPLKEEQCRTNREKPKIRVRVEHPFALMEKSLRTIHTPRIGLVRNAAKSG